MKVIKDQVRSLLGPTQTVSDHNLNLAYRRFLRHNGSDCHAFYAAHKIADFLVINGRVQKAASGKSARVSFSPEATQR
jgi:hypothetical protein